MVGASEVRIDLDRRARRGEAALELGTCGFIAEEAVAVRQGRVREGEARVERDGTLQEPDSLEIPSVRVVMKTFSGFRSRCTMPRAWAAASACAICRP